MSKKVTKQNAVDAMNNAFRRAGLPDFPREIVYALTTDEIRLLNRLWVAPVVGNLIAYGKKPGTNTACMCGDTSGETHDIGDGLPRCVTCGCY